VLPSCHARPFDTIDSQTCMTRANYLRAGPHLAACAHKYGIKRMSTQLATATFMLSSQPFTWPRLCSCCSRRFAVWATGLALDASLLTVCCCYCSRNRGCCVCTRHCWRLYHQRAAARLGTCMSTCRPQHSSLGHAGVGCLGMLLCWGAATCSQHMRRALVLSTG
jgi:hypothetical protein